ncbi:MAG: ABC transporter permease [Dehalococcoidia bacterium]|nr:ABC transporter permease [Dehalococcoidia bacterium]
MQKYILRRAALLLPTLIGITLVVFLAVRFLPGDVIDQMTGERGSANPEMRRQLEERYSLTGSVGRQYVEWLSDIAAGDLGTSITTNRPVTTDLRQRLPITFQLGTMALLISILVAIPVGILSAVTQDSVWDFLARSLSIGFLAVPSFWMGLLVLTYGFVWFGWVPPLNYRDLWEDPAQNFQIMIAPALILGAGLSGTVMRMTRSMMLEVLRHDFTRTARAKGLSPRVVIIRHALRNAILPVMTIVGLQVSVVVGGTVVLEQLFSIPGLGSLLLTAINTRDYPVVQGIVLLSAVVVVLSNFAVDIAYTLVDPRVRYA